MPRKLTAPVDFSDLDGCIRHMVDASGKSGVQVSREIGRSDNYLWSMLRNKTMPGVDLFVAIANACGYSVELTGPDFGNSETISLYVENGTLYANADTLTEDGTLDYSAVIDDSDEARIDASDPNLPQIDPSSKQELMTLLGGLLDSLKEQ